MADKEDRPDIVIEGNTATWDIMAEGDIQGTYTGTFRFKCFLTPTQALAASREYRSLLGDNPLQVPIHEDKLAFALAQLKYRIVSAPPFWTSTTQINEMAGDLPDSNIIMAVLDSAIAAEIKYMTYIRKKKLESLKKAKRAAERLLKNEVEDESEDQENSNQP